MRLDGKVALITGAASGMGRAAALVFAREGAAVTVCDLDADGVGQTVDAIEQQGGRALGVVADVSSAVDAQRMVAATVENFGLLNVLYNNAAIYLPHAGDTPVADLDEAIYERVVSVNLKGVFLGSKYTIPHMVAGGGGSIINTSSLAGTRGSSSSHAYAMAKGGVISLTLSLASTYGPRNIRANAIAPGAIDTPMVRTAGTMTDEVQKAFLPHVPLRRSGTAEEVANLALFLASDESSYLTGTVQIIDGGFSLG